MNFEMPKGFEARITWDEYILIKQNILAEHKTEIITILSEIQAGLNKRYVDCIKYGIENDAEILYAIRLSDGIEIAEPQKGVQHGISCPDLMRLLIELDENSVAIIHNHPNNGSFSLQDLYSLCEFKSIKLLAAIGHDGSVYEICTNGIYPDKEAIDKKYKEYMLTFYDNYHRMLVEGSISDYNEAEQFVRNDTIRAIADDFGWSYRRNYYYEKTECEEKSKYFYRKF